MPANWLYVVGGIIVGLLVFTIAYNLLTISMIQAQKQTALNNFENLYTDIETVCLQETNNLVSVKLNVPTSVRVIYVTNDSVNIIDDALDEIKNNETNKERNLCMQFVDEKTLRCKELTCNTTLPYMGSLPEYMDIKIMVKKILGQAPIKEYDLTVTKLRNGEVEVIIGG